MGAASLLLSVSCRSTHLSRGFTCRLGEFPVRPGWLFYLFSLFGRWLTIFPVHSYRLLVLRTRLRLGTLCLCLLLGCGFLVARWWTALPLVWGGTGGYRAACHRHVSPFGSSGHEGDLWPGACVWFVALRRWEWGCLSGGYLTSYLWLFT